jgi:hypothetical protein
MGNVTIEELRKVPYLDTRQLGARTVNLMPLWDGTHWRMWFPTSSGLVEGKIVDRTEGDYVSRTAAKPSDLFIPFVHLMWQRASWGEICPLIIAICDDFHNMGTSVAKLRHFFGCRCALPPGSAGRFARTELEYLVTLTRTVFDLLQEMISIIWQKKVKLLDESAENYRRGHSLPETFSKIVLQDKQRLKSADEIERQYRLPRRLAEQYANLTPFFLQLRDLRNRVVHGQGGFGMIFDTERGFCIDPKSPPFSSFTGWRPEHRYNENLSSALPWIADTILKTIDACNSLMKTFASIIQLPPEIAPGYYVFVRGPYNEALAEVLGVHSGASPWWG